MSQKNEYKILIVEDDPEISEMLFSFLQANGFNTFTASNGVLAVPLLASVAPDVIILDIVLPYMDGLAFLEKIRKQGVKTPVILLTEKKSLEDKLEGFDAGADDYVTKPFSPKELLARVNAVIRRSPETGEGKSTTNLPLTIGKLKIDPATREIRFSGTEIPSITKTEFDLLYYLAARPGIVVSRGELLENVLGYKHDCKTKSLTMHMANLRKKITQKAGDNFQLQAVSGVGYKLLADDAP